MFIHIRSLKEKLINVKTNFKIFSQYFIKKNLKLLAMVLLQKLQHFFTILIYQKQNK